MKDAYACYQGAGRRFITHYLKLAQAASGNLRPESRWKRAKQEYGTSFDSHLQLIEQAAIATLEAERLNLLHAVEWAHHIQEWSVVCQLADELAIFFNMRSYWGDWGNIAELAITDATLATNSKLEAAALNNMSVICRQVERLTDAAEYGQQSLALCRQHGYRYDEGLVLGNLAGIYFAQKELPASLEYYEAARQIFEELDDQYGQAQSLMGIGITLARQLRLAEAVSRLEACLALQREIGDRFGEAQTLNNLGISQRLLGQIPEAITSFQASLRLKHELGDRQGIATALTNLARAYQEAGELNQAIIVAEKALTLLNDLYPPEAKRVAQQLSRVKALKRNQEEILRP